MKSNRGERNHFETHVGQDSGSGTSHDTTTQVDTKLLYTAQVFLLFLCQILVRQFVTEFIDGELTDGIRNLLANQGKETGVETGESLGGGEFGKSGCEAGSVLL